MNRTVEHLMALLYFHAEGIITPRDRSKGFRESVITDLLNEGLIEDDPDPNAKLLYKTTPRAYAFIDYLLHLPLPEQVTEWRMPD